MIEQKELVNKSDNLNLAKNSDLNAKFITFVKKAELKAEQDKTVKLQTFDLSSFLANFFW